VFRRGPGKNVLALRWNTARDTFEEGQWLRGRIYERRCDLSPSGEYLVYFAAKFRGTYPTYTVVSRPPWLTALALWRGLGTWGGGGLFQDERTLLLNHRGSLTPDEGRVDGRIRVDSLGPHAGFGEDNPLWHTRLLRDGWTLAHPGMWAAPPGGALAKKTTVAGTETAVWWQIDPPMVYKRPQPTKPSAILEMRIHGLHELDGPWYAMEHAVMDSRGVERARLGRSDWADWDPSGDLLYAKEGRIHRVPREKVFAGEDAASTLVDLRPLRFTSREAPTWAREWKGKRSRV
jgi:hypothetical protein